MSLFSQEAPVLGNNATINGTRPPKVITLSIPLTTASATQVVFLNPIEVTAGIADSPSTYRFSEIRTAFHVASSSGTVQVEKLATTVAPGSGTALLTSALALSGTIDVVTAATPASQTTATLAAGDRLGIVIAGTLTGLSDCVINISLVRMS